VSNSLLLLSLLLGAWLAASSASAAPPACATETAELSAHVANVNSERGGRLYMHPKHPALCASPDEGQCKARAYIIPGDRVTLGDECEGWTWVKYQGAMSSTVGWVETERLNIADTRTAEPAADSGAAAGCATMERRLNGEAVPAGDQVDVSFLHLDPAPDSMKNDFSYYHSAALVVLHGRTVQLVRAVGIGTCHDLELSIWSEDFKTRLASASPDEEEEHPSSAGASLVMLDSRPYFLGQDRAQASIKLTRIEEDFSTTPMCSGARGQREPERVAEAADKALCAAVVAGKVETISLKKKIIDLSDDRAWAKFLEHHYLPPDIRFVAEGKVDIANTGKEERIGWAVFHENSDAGCGYDFNLEWPVVLGSGATFAADDPANAALAEALDAMDKVGPGPGNETAKLIRYKGQVLLDVQSPWDGDTPWHEVWKIEDGKVRTMCKFDMTIVRLSPVTSQSGQQ
jgi:hypothetical protein